MPEIGARSGAIFTREVGSRTVLYLLRLRSQIEVDQRDEYGEFAPLKSMLAEECIGVALNGSADPDLLSQDDALSLLQLEPGRNMHDGQKSLLIRQTLDSISTLDEAFTRLAHKRADELLADHRRIREASATKGLRYSVTPALPVDKIGVYVFMPMANL